MAKRIVREPEACDRLGIKRTKFRTDFRFNDPSDPLIAGLNHPRLRPISIGVRNHGFLEHEIEQVVSALMELRDTAPVRTRAKASQQRRKRK